MHLCGCDAINRASSTAPSSAPPASVNRFASPIRSASSPDTPRPVKIKSSAWLCPISRGSRTVPKSIRGTPNRLQNTPKVAFLAATRKSHQIASSNPPATAYPSTAAITGFDKRIRVGPIGPSPSELKRLLNAFKSAPAQKFPPAPVKIATSDDDSSNSRKACASASAVSRSTALRTAGR